MQYFLCKILQIDRKSTEFRINLNSTRPNSFRAKRGRFEKESEEYHTYNRIVSTLITILATMHFAIQFRSIENTRASERAKSIKLVH